MAGSLRVVGGVGAGGAGCVSTGHACGDDATVALSGSKATASGGSHGLRVSVPTGAVDSGHDSGILHVAAAAHAAVAQPAGKGGSGGDVHDVRVPSVPCLLMARVASTLSESAGSYTVNTPVPTAPQAHSVPCGNTLRRSAPRSSRPSPVDAADGGCDDRPTGSHKRQRCSVRGLVDRSGDDQCDSDSELDHGSNVSSNRLAVGGVGVGQHGGVVDDDGGDNQARQPVPRGVKRLSRSSPAAVAAPVGVAPMAAHRRGRDSGVPVVVPIFQRAPPTRPCSAASHSSTSGSLISVSRSLQLQHAPLPAATSRGVHGSSSEDSGDYYNDDDDEGGDDGDEHEDGESRSLGSSSSDHSFVSESGEEGVDGRDSDGDHDGYDDDDVDVDGDGDAGPHGVQQVGHRDDDTAAVWLSVDAHVHTHARTRMAFWLLEPSFTTPTCSPNIVALTWCIRWDAPGPSTSVHVSLLVLGCLRASPPFTPTLSSRLATLEAA